ncbi:MAG: PAS domain-containing protein [Alphaproteobacteria bacterium]|nr:PAS domain-containing protein [Alphaproteobacteria bacterium]
MVLVLAKPRLPDGAFRLLAASAVICTAIGLGATILRAPVEGAWIAAAVLALVAVACTAAYLVWPCEEDDRQRELDTLINTVPALLWTADGVTGGVDYINRPWHELGWTLEDIGGDKWVNMMHPGDVDRLVIRWQHSMETAEPYEETMRVRRKWGDYRWTVIRATPTLDKNGVLRRWYGVATDIDDLKRAEERLEVMRSDLARVSRANTMGQLTASIAHEINQPLAASVTNGQVALRWLAADAPDMTEVVEAVQESVASARRASDVVERLRGLYGKSESVAMPVDLGMVISDTVSLTSAAARAAGVTLDVKVSGDLAPVLGDAIQFQQVLINLVLNGVDAIRNSGSETGSVSIRAISGAKDLVMEVEDTGTGIPSADLGHIFDAFYSTKSSGLGMGLAISRTIVERLNGTITVTNGPDGGALFRVTLPFAEAGVADPSDP